MGHTRSFTLSLALAAFLADSVVVEVGPFEADRQTPVTSL